MNSQVLAPHVLMIFNDLLVITIVNLRFVLGSILEAILARFGIYCGALGGQKVIKMSSKIGAKIGIGKNRLRGGPG